MLTRVFIWLVTATLLCLTPQVAQAHCQVPCGIYDDKAHLGMMQEDITTIEKAMNQISELSAATPVNYNQVVRWVNIKELHADKLMETVTSYWMTQRLKLSDPNDEAATEKYLTQLTTLHHILIYAMKAKQTTDLENATQLRDLTHNFSHQYFGQPDTSGNTDNALKPCPHGKACPHANCQKTGKCPKCQKQCKRKL